MIGIAADFTRFGVLKRFHKWKVTAAALQKFEPSVSSPEQGISKTHLSGTVVEEENEDDEEENVVNNEGSNASENNGDISPEGAAEEDSKAAIDVVGIFDAEISKSGAQLAQMLRTQASGSYPAQRVRDQATKARLREICIEMMNEIISKYVTYKQQFKKPSST